MEIQNCLTPFIEISKVISSPDGHFIFFKQHLLQYHMPDCTESSGLLVDKELHEIIICLYPTWLSKWQSQNSLTNIPPEILVIIR